MDPNDHSPFKFEKVSGTQRRAEKTVNFLTLNRWRTCQFLPYISCPVVATMEIVMYVDIHTHT